MIEMMQKSEGIIEIRTLRYMGDKFKQYLEINKRNRLSYNPESKIWDTRRWKSNLKIKQYISDLLAAGIPIEGTSLELMKKRCFEESVHSSEYTEQADFSNVPTNFDQAFELLKSGKPANIVCIYNQQENRGDSVVSKFKVLVPMNSPVKGLFSEKARNLSKIIEKNRFTNTFDTFDIELVKEIIEKIKINYPNYEIFYNNVEEALETYETEKLENQLPIAEIERSIAPGFSLKPHQNEAIRFLQKLNGRAILAYDMGLGKTLIALAYILLTGKRAVILCPKTNRRNWVSEAMKFFGINAFELTPQFRDYQSLSSYPVVVTNYEGVRKHPLKELGFEIVIVDESHRCKNPFSKTTRAVTHLSQEMKHVVLLSGTPIKNRKEELFSQVRMLFPNLWESYEKVRKMPIAKVYTDIQPFYLYRSKTQVLKELPPIEQRIVDVEIENCERLNHSFFGLKDVTRKKVLGEFQRIKAMLAREKVSEAIRIIENLMAETTSKVLVFSDFVPPIEAVADHFGDLAILHHADMKDEEREKRKLDFQSGNSKARIFVTTRASCNEGVTLTAADTVVFIDLPWSPADIQQAAARVHRIGQTEQVSEYWLQARNCIMDGKIISVIKRKLAICKMVLEGKMITEEERKWIDSPITLADLGIQFKKEVKKHE